MALTLKLGDAVHEVEIVRRRPKLVLRIDGRLHEVDALGPAGDGAGRIAVDGREVPFVRVAAEGAGMVRLDGRTVAFEIVDPFDAGEGSGGHRDEILAPMPGAVVQVHKGAGEGVARGEPILTIESMKLQTVLVAPRDGTLAAVLRSEGETFEKDEVVARLDPVVGGA